MNIQLRDSKVLQEAIKAGSNRKELPKAQLHPMLLNGIAECDREGLDIRSECLFGENRGDPNPQDVINLKRFLPAPAECEGKWTIINLKQGDSTQSIPSELVFTFPDKSKLAIHTQAVSDTTKLTNALPSDQSARFTATPGEGRISFKRVGAPLPQAVISPSIIGELQTQAAILGVEWDKTASPETMVERISAARAARAAKEAAKDEKPAKVMKKELQTV